MFRRKDHPRRSKIAGGFTLIVLGICFLVPTLSFGTVRGFPPHEMAFPGLLLVGLGLIRLGSALPQIIAAFPRWGQLPKKEVMRLAEARGGILTLSEISTALDIDPARAEKTLKALAKMGIATQRWEDFRRNVWEFPDYIRLPIAETIDLAKRKGGRISLSDLVASGQSMEVATQTLDTLSQKGLAQQDPAASSRAVILTSQ